MIISFDPIDTHQLSLILLFHITSYDTKHTQMSFTRQLLVSASEKVGITVKVPKVIVSLKME